MALLVEFREYERYRTSADLVNNMAGQIGLGLRALQQSTPETVMIVANEVLRQHSGEATLNLPADITPQDSVP